MDRPIAGFDDGQLWLDDGGIVTITGPERLRMKLLVMKDHNTAYAQQCVADIEKALADFQSAQQEEKTA